MQHLRCKTQQWGFGLMARPRGDAPLLEMGEEQPEPHI